MKTRVTIVSGPRASGKTEIMRGLLAVSPPTSICFPISTVRSYLRGDSDIRQLRGMRFDEVFIECIKFDKDVIDFIDLLRNRLLIPANWTLRKIKVKQ